MKESISPISDGDAGNIKRVISFVNSLNIYFRYSEVREERNDLSPSILTVLKLIFFVVSTKLSLISNV